jgi:pimeloyl-ACP methyl ester carboxylesterase
MNMTAAQVTNGGVRLPITCTGSGPTIIFVNGMGATQAAWGNIVRKLKRRYRVVTFDLRGHGRASPVDDHSFEALLSDVNCVMATIDAQRPIVVGWSLGADLAVAYASDHPGKLGGLFLLDGAVPLSEPMVRDEAALRRRAKSPAMAVSLWLNSLTPMRYSLSGDDITDIALSADAYRQRLLEIYDRVDCPITMALATKALGRDKSDETQRKNRLWREGAERLTARHPEIGVTWVDAGHLFPLTKPGVVARMIDAFAHATAAAGSQHASTETADLPA